MRLLLDTHALIWFLEGSPKLTRIARTCIETHVSETFVSAVTALEVTTKFLIGKAPQFEVLALDFEARVKAQGFASLPITAAHAVRAGLFKITHKDPFDRMLIAQSQLEALTLVSNETLFDAFGVSRVW